MKINIKSQITIFIILAIIILGGIGVFFIVKSDILNIGKNAINPDVKPLYSFVENCIKETGYEAVDYVSKTGGYYNIPELSTNNEIAYYFYEGKSYMPTKEQIENEISEYVNQMLYACIKDFYDFPDFNIKQGVVKTITKIEDDKVVLTINYPLSISKGEKTYEFNDFEDEILIRLGIIYDVAKKITESHFDDKSICLDCIYELADESDTQVTMMGYDDATIFSIIDENSKINNESFVYNFANKYNAIEWE